ncbi:ABC transporter ATP-binding protein [Lederbergia lenta]|uniref:Oligopeptide ABC transporter ATP-binding protein n=1 Tax=Lederbergia lenta TaxID=1467 RepID=A0A2X4Z4H0_LEDLE|nr:ABC transporter ATP-binding protein [Lederbergia lenta]MEC2325390.1 ABC transporter ATP-binding protein [Lederbergia lenta]SQI55544.1 oligopeptide ABC transporter ATP-binding protein [Lederbergia lenta]
MEGNPLILDSKQFGSDIYEDDEIILEVNHLKVNFQLDEGLLEAVSGVDFQLKKGRTLGIVGESGSGKSVTAKAIMQIVDTPGKVDGEISFRSRKNNEINDIGKLDQKGNKIRSIRGGEISMIFQEPMKAFSPIHTIGNQLVEGIMLHVAAVEEEARKIAIDTLRKVGMSNPEQRIDQYPHELSGGMRQRAMIAMALCCNPSILIADEPTTALDVTVQAQVLDLINNLKEKSGSSVIFITHDLGVIAEMSDEVAVMYLGKMVEYTDVDTLFFGALHPYTQGLLKSIPTIGMKDQRLESIEGIVPTPINLPKGCGFYSRCKYAKDGVCNVEDIPLKKVKEGHFVRCVRV